MKDERKNLFGHLLAFLCIFIWGITLIFTKKLLNIFSATEILILRFGFAYLFLWIMRPKKMKLQKKRHELLFFLAGFLGIAFYYLLENVALLYTTATNVGIIAGAQPFFVNLAAHFITKKEKLRKNYFIGFVLSIIGIVLVSGNGGFSFHAGDFIMLFSLLVWVFYTILSRKISDLGYDPIISTRKMFFYGFFCMIPCVVWKDFDITHFTALAEPSVLISFLFLGCIACGACFAFWNYAIANIGSVKTTIYIYAQPIVTVIASALFLNETITPMILTGILLTILGLVISGNYNQDRSLPKSR